MKEKKNGRPSKLTPEITERFLNAIKLGAPYELACKYAGITYQTLLNWRGRKEDAFLEFFEGVTRAEGAAAIQWLALLEKHSHADGKWASWKLERRYPEHFGRQDKITQEVTIEQVNPRDHYDKLKEEFGGKLSDETLIAITSADTGASKEELVH